MRPTKKRLLTVFLLSLILIAGLFGCSKKEKTLDFPEAPNDPIALNSENFVSELTKYCHSGAKFYLTEDINITADEWTPIGRTFGTAFNGELDGKGHTISGLKTSETDANGDLFVLKRILGWKADGTPVYASSKIVHMETKTNGDYKEVTDIVCEGEENDPDYADMAKDGTFEPQTSFGSLGLFGYTYGAKITDLKIVGADFRFYGDGDNVYAGIVSGYDIASDFSGIEITDCSIYASTVERVEIRYFAANAKPEKVLQDNNTKQYVGGIVGYSRGNALVDGKNVGYKTTVFDRITVNNLIVDNTNNSAVWDAKLSAVYSQFDDSAQSNDDYLILKTDLTEEEGFGSYLVESGSVTVKPVKQVFVGGVSGYSVGATVKDVEINGVNKNSETNRGHKLTAHKINAGGVSAALLGAESSAKNVTVKNVEFNTEKVKIGAMIGGAFGEIKSATVTTPCTVSGQTKLIYGGSNSSGETVCIGGFAAYCNENARISGLTVDGSGEGDIIYIQSSYRDKTGNLGSILGGLVGVLRDSSLNDSKAKSVVFRIKDSTGDNDYCFTRNAVAQVYGNSRIEHNVETIDCKYYQTAADTVSEHTVIKPVVAKNNYVNENGETSARLYYIVDGESAGVYVTVYGDLIPLLKGNNYRLREEDVYIALTEEQKTEMRGDDDMIPKNGKYYFFETTNQKWQNIQSTAADVIVQYDPDRLYGLAKAMYRVELPASEIGKSIPAGITFYTFDEKNGALVPQSGTFRDTTYYVDCVATNLGGYELDLTVYTESDKIIEASKAGAENIETTTYVVPLERFDPNVNVYDDNATVLYIKCPAEVYLDVYFRKGTGFIADKNGYSVAADASGNRNYASYDLVDGRPVIAENAISYKSN